MMDQVIIYIHGQGGNADEMGEIYAKAFPIEHWGIDWNSDNANALEIDNQL